MHLEKDVAHSVVQNYPENPNVQITNGLYYHILKKIRKINPLDGERGVGKML